MKIIFHFVLEELQPEEIPKINERLLNWRLIVYESGYLHGVQILRTNPLQKLFTVILCIKSCESLSEFNFNKLNIYFNLLEEKLKDFGYLKTNIEVRS
ncbi:MAG: hypothetical protein IPG12_10660 [Saprospiraceae bacterium]|nr:hypothetical protein [Saprospiraceae bacterium]